MTDLASFLLLSAAAFAGAFVSGLAGFAFSAVAGAILLHVFKVTSVSRFETEPGVFEEVCSWRNPLPLFGNGSHTIFILH